MINRAAISNVRTDLKKYDADAHITNKQIYTILNKHSKWLLKRESDTFRLARINRIYQEYKCAEVIDVPKIDPCCGIVTKCTIKRTKSKIPDLYEDILGVLIKRVTSIDGSTVEVEFRTGWGHESAGVGRNRFSIRSAFESAGS
jgi:hypothetical protein